MYKIGTFLFFCLGLISYVATLYWLDQNFNIFQNLKVAIFSLPLIFILSLVSYFFRFLRFRYLLENIGYRFPFFYGFLAYIAGFSLTATPGKVGELIRIRYFSKMRVSREAIFSTFILERGLDLIALVLLSCFSFDAINLMAPLLFIILFLCFVLFLSKSSYLFKWLENLFLNFGFIRGSNLISFVGRAFVDINKWSALNIIKSFFVGLLAWILTSFSLIYILLLTGADYFNLHLIGVYPVALLVGAISMLPGGLGTTEAAIILQLKSLGMLMPIPVLVAILVRLGTIWFSIFIGFASLLLLEFRIFNSRKFYHE